MRSCASFVDLRIRLASFAVLAGALLLAAHPGLAQPQKPAGGEAFPARPVTIVVPFTPGGSPDILARTVGQKLSEKWKQPVIVENRPGAGGNTAASFVAKAAPDGYTLLMGTDGPLAINPHVYQRLPFDPQRDFSPIGALASVDFMLVTHPDFPAGQTRELVAYAGTQKTPLMYGSSGVGSQHHLGMEMFKSTARVAMTHVPYKGVVPALTDVMGGHVAAMFVAVPTAVPYVRSGKLKAIAVSGLQRSPLAAKVPTLDESGLPGFELRAWFGLLAPAGTPPEIIKQINADVNRVIAAPDVKAKLGEEGFEVQGDTPNAFRDFIASESRRWKQVVTASGAKAD